MKIWLVYDADPDGGHLSAQSWEPDLSLLRRSELEVRSTDVDDEMWARIMEGDIAVNEEDPYSLDHIWLPYWGGAEVVWEKQPDRLDG